MEPDSEQDIRGYLRRTERMLSVLANWLIIMFAFAACEWWRDLSSHEGGWQHDLLPYGFAVLVLWLGRRELRKAQNSN